MSDRNRTVRVTQPGYATDWDQVVFRGDVAKREFIAFWLKDGLVRAGMDVGVSDVTDPIKALINSRRPVERAALADPDVPRERLAQAEEPHDLTPAA